MAELTFADSHNMVAYLKKSEDNADFAEMVDFLNASPIRKTKRKATKISQSSGPTILVADETVHEERGDNVERADTTATRLDAEQGSGNINRTQSTAITNDHFPYGIGSGGSTKCQDTMGDIPIQTRVLGLKNVKDAQALEIKKLKKRVKKLESKKKSRTPQLKRRLFKVGIESSAEKSLEDSETQGRYGHDIGVTIASTSITTASINITTVELVTTISAPITTACVSVITAEPSTPPTTTTLIEDEDLIISQTLMKMRSVKSKEKSKEKGVSSKTATTTTRGVTMQEPSESGTRKTVPPPQHDPKDKVKAKMIKPEKPLKKEDHIKFDKEMAKRLTEELQAELEEEERLAQRLQAEEQRELTIKERSKLFVELMDKRKKHFAKLRAEEIRRKPPTKPQKRNQMYSFVPMDSKVVKGSKSQAEGSKKRTRKELDEESVKRQKLEDDAERQNLKLADGSTKFHKIFSVMLDDFDRQDVLDLYRLVKERFEITSPEGYDRLLWGDLITLFEPSEEDEI
ncbi:hypothetical protein Tco_1577262 [Tanacetum coccineum]